MGKYIIAIDPSYYNCEISVFEEENLMEQYYLVFNSKNMNETAERIKTFLNVFASKKPILYIEDRLPFINKKFGQPQKFNIGSELKLSNLRWLIIGIAKTLGYITSLVQIQTWRSFYQRYYRRETEKYYIAGKWVKDTSYKLALDFQNEKAWLPKIKRDGESVLIGLYAVNKEWGGLNDE